jgi:hypothetical protein
VVEWWRTRKSHGLRLATLTSTLTAAIFLASDLWLHIHLRNVHFIQKFQWSCNAHFIQKFQWSWTRFRQWAGARHYQWLWSQKTHVVYASQCTSI